MKPLFTRRALGASIAAAGIVTVLGPVAAHADSFIALSGVSGGTESLYGYVGLIGTLNGLGTDSPVFRLWGDRLNYSYVANATKVNASSWGASASIGYQFKYSSGMLTGYVGVDERDTVLSPNVVSVVRGEHVGPRVEVDETQNLPDRLQFRLIGSYAASTNDYWTRGQLLYPVTQGVLVGPEFIVQGNPEYSAHSVGATVGVARFGRSASFNVDAGYEKLENLAGSAYGALSLAFVF